VLIYDQTCAAEKRRRRKRGEYPDPPRRIFINADVCEACGDCGHQSNCLSIVPVETEFGRKRMIEQSSCNKDYSCANGFCPSFVSVLGGKVRKPAGVSLDEPAGALDPRGDSGESRYPVGEHLPGTDRASSSAANRPAQLPARLSSLPLPPPHDWTGPYDLLVTGVGGTGVVTIGALITMAAHLEGKSASVLDFMGFAQKGGMVLSFVRFADVPERLHQVRIDTQQADAILACDMVVGASEDALQTAKRGRTQIVANAHEIQTAAFVHNPHADLRTHALLEKMRFAAGADRVLTCDSHTLAERLLGDTIGANILLMGFAWQRGLVPVSLAALERAIELNGVSVEMNKKAFAFGRLAAADPGALEALSPGALAEHADTMATMDLESLIDHRERFLTQYQNASYAARYRSLVEQVRVAEQKVVPPDTPLRLTRAVACYYAKLLAYKDEYQVARLYTDGKFERQLNAQFEGDFTLRFHMAPPSFARSGKDGGAPRKITIGPWLMPAMRLLAKGKVLRGTRLDIFGHTEERKLERKLITDYSALITQLLPRLTRANLDVAIDLAEIPDQIRGYGHIKLANIAVAKAREKELLGRLEEPRALAAGLSNTAESGR
jgi:indolepyruvate ferredoxin oxidoreductase